MGNYVISEMKPAQDHKEKDRSTEVGTENPPITMYYRPVQMPFDILDGHVRTSISGTHQSDKAVPLEALRDLNTVVEVVMMSEIVSFFSDKHINFERTQRDEREWAVMTVKDLHWYLDVRKGEMTRIKLYEMLNQNQITIKMDQSESQMIKRHVANNILLMELNPVAIMNVLEEAHAETERARTIITWLWSQIEQRLVSYNKMVEGVSSSGSLEVVGLPVPIPDSPTGITSHTIHPNTNSIPNPVPGTSSNTSLTALAASSSSSLSFSSSSSSSSTTTTTIIYPEPEKQTDVASTASRLRKSVPENHAKATIAPIHRWQKEEDLIPTDPSLQHPNHVQYPLTSHVSSSSGTENAASSSRLHSKDTSVTDTTGGFRLPRSSVRPPAGKHD